MNILQQWKIQAVVEVLGLALGWLSFLGFLNGVLTLPEFLGVQLAIGTFAVVWWLSWSYRQIKQARV